MAVKLFEHGKNTPSSPGCGHYLASGWQDNRGCWLV